MGLGALRKFAVRSNFGLARLKFCTRSGRSTLQSQSSIVHALTYSCHDNANAMLLNAFPLTKVSTIFVLCIDGATRNSSASRILARAGGMPKQRAHAGGSVAPSVDR